MLLTRRSLPALFRILAGLLALMAPAGASPADFKPLHINCGGGDITDKANGIVWVADKKYIVKGKKYRFNTKLKPGEIEGAPPEEVYASVRRANIAYKFPKLPDGLYRVRMHFVDAKKLAKRSMDFWLESEHLIRNLNVRDAAGGANRGYVFEGIVEVKDGNGLQIRGSKGHGDDVFLSALEILPAPPGSVPTPGTHTLPDAPGDMAARLRVFAGGAVRLVWTRVEEEEDFYGAGSTGTLVGYDTEDGGGEREILPGGRSYARPILTPDGQRVVFTDQALRRCFVVGFNGKGLREVAAGYASDVWQDPATGRTWVYVRTGWRDPMAPIERHDLDAPGKGELVWTKSATGQPQIAYFQLSGDGSMAADGFPWPQCGLADVARGDFTIQAKGCWPSVAPDESHRSFVFTGKHTSIQFFDEPGAQAKLINLATVPGWTGRKLYHPRWTNHVRYLTATAPQWMPETELYLGRFDERFTRVEGWFRITYNEKPDFFGDAWFASAHTPAKGTPAAPIPPPSQPVIAGRNGGHEPGLIYVWESERSKNAILDAQGQVVRRWSARYEGETRPNRWDGADIRHGALRPDDDAAGVIATALAGTGAFTMSLDVTAWEEASAKDGVVAYMGSQDGGTFMALEQGKGAFQVRVRTGSGPEVLVPMGPVQPVAPRQMAITYANGRLTGYSNGQETSHVEWKADLAAWKPTTLIFGQDANGSRSWSGSLENARVYDRALPLERLKELHQKSALAWAERTPAPRVVVEAELLQASEPDDPETIAPYVRSLGENVYRVKRVVSGELQAKEIVVLQWVILGGKVLPSAERHEGQVYQLTLEPADSHAQLSGEHRSSDIFEPEMEVYYDVGG